MTKLKQNNSHLFEVPQPEVIKGPKGEKGQPGDRGFAGQRGDIGPRGRSGFSTQIVGSFSTNSPANLPRKGTFTAGWDDGNFPSVPLNVEIGESVLHVPTQDLWCFTPGSTTTNWTNIGKVAGAQGVVGARGDKGEAGIKGDQGLTGKAGKDGFPGVPGKDGTNGVDGEKGEKGSIGQAGPRGSAGPAGKDGVDGTKGDVGPAGKDGRPGMAGTDGSKGDQGVAGQKGTKGDQGPDPDARFFPRVAVSFDGTNCNIFDSYNVQKVERIAIGEYRIWFQRHFSNINYTIHATAGGSRQLTGRSVAILKRSTRSVDIKVKNASSGGGVDETYVSILVYKFSN